MITQSCGRLGKPAAFKNIRKILYRVLEEQESLAKLVNDMLWLVHRQSATHLKILPD